MNWTAIVTVANLPYSAHNEIQNGWKPCCFHIHFRQNIARMSNLLRQRENVDALGPLVTSCSLPCCGESRWSQRALRAILRDAVATGWKCMTRVEWQWEMEFLCTLVHNGNGNGLEWHTKVLVTTSQLECSCKSCRESRWISQLQVP